MMETKTEISKEIVLSGKEFAYKLQRENQEKYEKITAELSILHEKQEKQMRKYNELKTREEEAGSLFIPGRYEKNREQMERYASEIKQMEQLQTEMEKQLQRELFEKQNISQIIKCMDHLYMLQGEMEEKEKKTEAGEETSAVINLDGEENLDCSSMQKEIILEIQEFERKRIARDLHDTTVQNLAALVHKIEFVEKLVDMDMLRAKLELNVVQNTIRNSIEDIRNIIYNLHPMQINDLGLIATLEKFVGKFTDESGMAIHFLFSGEDCSNTTISLALFRIVQEACNNSVRYSKANQIIIEYKNENNEIYLRIEDNGIGFDLDESPKKALDEGRGFGLSVMKERVYLLSGKLEIESNIDKGTKIIVKIPCLAESLDSLH